MTSRSRTSAGFDHLDRDGSIEPSVAGEIHDPHRTPAELAFDDVPAVDDGLWCQRELRLGARCEWVQRRRARGQVLQAEETANAVLDVDDEVAFFQFGEINVERGAGGERMRRFQPARTLDFVAAKNFRVGDNDEFGPVTKETARKSADLDLGFGVQESWGCVARGAVPKTGTPKTKDHQLFPDFFKPLSFAIVVAKDVDRVALPQPAMKLVEKFPAPGLGDLQFGCTFASDDRPQGVEIADFSESWLERPNSRYHFRQFTAVSACGRPSLKFIPTDKKWIVTGNFWAYSPAWTAGSPVRRGEKSFLRQVIQKGGERRVTRDKICPSDADRFPATCRLSLATFSRENPVRHQGRMVILEIS